MNANDEFIHHAARAFFASAWADQVEEAGAVLRGEIMDQMPDEIDPAAMTAARNLLRDMLRDNDCADAAALLAKCPDEGDRPHTLETLGHYAAMQSMGHGVGLEDAFGDGACLRVTYGEFGSHSLERDYRPETETVFRVYPDGDVIALFPYEAADRRGALYACVCYQHVGQHGGADYDAVIDSTRPASEDESRPLADELERIGYRIKRITRRSRAKAARA